jgi:hypothetical protein
MKQRSTLLFTPVHPDRTDDDFLDPCRNRRRMLSIMYALDRVEDDSAGPERTNPGRINGLGAVYEKARLGAIEKGYKWLFIVEDDEEPPVDILRKFRRVVAKTGTQVVTGLKPLRKTQPVKYVPWLWNWGMLPMGVHGLVSISEIRPGQRTDPFPFFGQICPPFLMDLSLGVAFSDKETFTYRGGGWDTRFSEELFKAKISAWCEPTVVTKHYCVDTHTILT